MGPPTLPRHLEGKGVGTIGSSAAAPEEPNKPMEMATRVAGRLQMSRTKPKRSPTLAIELIKEGAELAGATPLARSSSGTSACTGAAGGNAGALLDWDIVVINELLQPNCEATRDSTAIAAEAVPRTTDADRARGLLIVLLLATPAALAKH